MSSKKQEFLRKKSASCRERFHTYRTVYTWGWQKLATVDMEPGEHVLSIAAETTGMAIDRVNMTTGDENPPMDAEWLA